MKLSRKQIRLIVEKVSQDEADQIRFKKIKSLLADEDISNFEYGVYLATMEAEDGEDQPGESQFFDLVQDVAAALSREYNTLKPEYDRMRNEEVQTQKEHDELNDFIVGPVGGPLPYTLDEKPALVKKYFALRNKLADLEIAIYKTRIRLEYLKPRVEALSDLSLRHGTTDDYVNIDDFLMERK